MNDYPAVEKEVDELSEFELRKRHTAAQSSTLDVWYLDRHALTADSTKVLAALERVADATMSITSLFERTSQTCHNKIREKVNKDRYFWPLNVAYKKCLLPCTTQLILIINAQS